MSKAAVKSKTMWGGVAAILSGASIVIQVFDQSGALDISMLATGVASVIGGGVSIYGRYKAFTSISGVIESGNP